MHHPVRGSMPLQPINQAAVLLGLARTSPITDDWVVRAEMVIQALYASHEGCSDPRLRLQYARYIESLQGLISRAAESV